MRANSLEEIIPGLREAREGERAARAVAFGGLTLAVCGEQCVPLAPRHRLEMQLTKNAFATELPPLHGDVFAFLWRLNPHYRKAPRWMSRSWRERNVVEWNVGRMNLDAAVAEIRAFIAAMMQDLPEGAGDSASLNPPENYVHWLAGEANFYLSVYPGFTLAGLMDTPYLVLQQLYRAYKLAREEHPQFINRSDRIAANWHRAHLPKREEAHEN